MERQLARPFLSVGIVVLGYLFSSLSVDWASAQEVKITANGENSGTVRVVSSPTGIDCPGECRAEFPDGLPVTLVAQPNPKTHFEGFWFHENYLDPGGHRLGSNCRGLEDEVTKCFLPGSDDAVIDLQYYLIPEPGISGVSINDGDVFTNDPNVQLTVRWPFGSSFMTISNDGGFGNSKEFDLQFKTGWTLQSSGPERLPKTVYALFNGGGTRFTDDIILDQTPPVIVNVVAADGQTSALAALRSGISTRGSRLVTLRVRAIDRTSGISKIQIGARPNRKLKKVQFKRRLAIRTSSRRIWLRVFDRAENPSRWKLVRVE